MGDFLPDLFLTVLDMSFTASYCILFIMLARLFLKKAPKVFSYSLWAVVLFRLVCPFSIFSVFSFLRIFNQGLLKTTTSVSDSGLLGQPQLDTGVSSVDAVINNSLPAATPYASADPMQIIMAVLAAVWILGVLVLVAYSVLSYILLRKRVAAAVLVQDNIFESEHISSPFVLGMIRPKIYLPIGILPAEKNYILEHERTHIRRRDYLIKPLAFLLLCAHWFNPLVWISFVLMSRDMEMSCDEKVLKNLGQEIKKDYSTSLLSLSAGNKLISGCPLAFGESNARVRIKNVLDYKQPAVRVMLITLLAVVCIGMGLVTDPANANDSAYLNPKNVMVLLEKQEKVLVISDYGNTFLAGQELASWLGAAADDWKKKAVSTPYEFVPSITIKVSQGAGQEIRLYESKPELAMILSDNQWQYYSIKKEDYEKIKFTLLTRDYNLPEVYILLNSGKKTGRESVADAPAIKNPIRLEVEGEIYFIYQQDGKYYVEKPYEFINEITGEVYDKIRSSGFTAEAYTSETVELVDKNLNIIMTSPLTSSDPNDYVKAHRREYENIIKYGSDALHYMLAEFNSGRAGDDLRGQLMMRLCKELLGAKNNVPDESLSPTTWYAQLRVRKEIKLPDFSYNGKDAILQLVYGTETERNGGNRNNGFVIVAPHVFASFEEGNKLKVFATTFCSYYRLYDKVLANEGGSIVPVAITYIKNSDGSYALDEYVQAKDGSYFVPSIKEFCTMPISGKKIVGLADKIMAHYGNYADIIKLERSNLIQHLKANGQTGIFLQEDEGEVDKLTQLTE